MLEYEKPKQKEIPPSSLIVQRVRKRVKGSASSFSDDDIYYDKSNNKYYNKMHQEESEQDVTVEVTEWRKCRDLSAKPGRDEKNTIMAEAKQAEQVKFIRFENKAGTELGGGKLRFTAIPFDKGSELLTQPKTIRLYAEGNMDHAHSLAQSLTSPENYSKFYDLTNNYAAAAAAPFDVLIKATEFDSQEGVVERYMDKAPVFQIDKIPNLTPEQRERFQSDKSFSDLAIEAYDKGTKNLAQLNDEYRVFYEAGQAEYNASVQSIREKLNAAHTDERLEASFGTNSLRTTGDLSRDVSSTGVKRQYDIIQTTFFWLPNKNNLENFCALKKFYLNQRYKLKQNGKIRITLTNANRGGYTNFSTSNGYLFVAEQLCRNSEIKRYYDIKKLELKDEANSAQKYSDRLNALGLNPAGFKHTQTKKNEEVSSRGDLVIEATLKPTPEVPRVSETPDTH